MRYNKSTSKRDHVFYFTAYTEAKVARSSSLEIHCAKFVSIDDLKLYISPENFEIVDIYCEKLENFEVNLQHSIEQIG